MFTSIILLILLIPIIFLTSTLETMFSKDELVDMGIDIPSITDSQEERLPLKKQKNPTWLKTGYHRHPAPMQAGAPMSKPGGNMSFSS